MTFAYLRGERITGYDIASREIFPCIDMNKGGVAKLHLYWNIFLQIDKRFEVVFWWTPRRGVHFGIKKIAAIVRCLTRTVKKWIERWEIDRSLSDRMKSGRPRASIEVEDNIIEDVVNTADEVFTKDIHQTLGKQNINISKRTLRRRLKEKGYRYMAQLSKALLTQKHIEESYQWAVTVQDQEWDHVITADETIIRLNIRKMFSWKKTEQRARRRVVQFLVKINIFPRKTSVKLDALMKILTVISCVMTYIELVYFRLLENILDVVVNGF